MLKASLSPYQLDFKFLARTSRETFTRKDTFFLKVFDEANPSLIGTGEVAFFPSLQLSFSNYKEFENQLIDFTSCINDYVNGRELPNNSAIRFGFETAMADLAHGGKGLILPESILENITDGIPINGLVWMSSVEEMERQIAKKIDEGFDCLKLKVGNNDFRTEIELLRNIRASFPASVLSLRLDANGAFNAENIFDCLNQLSTFDIHSIEQPLPRNHPFTKEVCRFSPISVALDEDMIERWWSVEESFEWLKSLSPSYIIIKPSLIGGFEKADTWIDIAENLNIGWWATSALESNIGLSAIAQWLSTHPSNLNVVHGLGTGGIYKNNLPSRVSLDKNRIKVVI